MLSCNDFSYWNNPDKIDNIEHLRQMEDSLRESIERIRIHKVCCFLLVIVIYMHFYTFFFQLQRHRNKYAHCMPHAYICLLYICPYLTYDQDIACICLIQMIGLFNSIFALTLHFFWSICVQYSCLGDEYGDITSKDLSNTWKNL